MKTIIDTPSGLVRFFPNKSGTFDLEGSPESVAAVMTACPALMLTGNPLEIAFHCIGRLMELEAVAGPGTNRLPVLKSQKEMQDDTFTENPLVFFQTREPLTEIREAWSHLCEDVMSAAREKGGTAEAFQDALDEADLWKTERVFIDPGEAERFVAAQRHRYPEDKENESWRLYTGIADGVLKVVVKETRDLAQI